MKIKTWYKLDNVGKFYASIKNTKIPKVFRYSAILVDDIDENILQEALNNTTEVFTNFNVNLKRGLFWYYLDETSKINKVLKENLPVCFKLYNNSDDFLYRVSYYKRKINFEVSHIISDGRGSVEFFKLLLTNYVNIKYNLNIDTSINNSSALEKTEDSFTKYYQKVKKTKKEKQIPYIYNAKKYKNQTRFMECNINVKDVLKIAHQYNTTLTGILVSILIFSFKDELKLSDMGKYIKIDIPVDLRNYFKSSSSMNFFGLTTISYKFTSKEDSYTRDLLRRKFFDGDYLQALVAIKCLDEGVNIPAIKTAFILASTTNPKEYIQRRGRVLRKYPGKEFAIIYDFITLPRPLDEAINLTYEEIKCEKSMVRNEVNRMIEFNRLAMSKMEADKLIYEITDTYRLNEDDKLDDNIEMEEIYYE